MTALSLLNTWNSHGIHRTASPGDVASLSWLLSQSRSFGLENYASIKVESFPMDCVEVLDCYVEFEDGGKVEGVPVFDAVDTEEDGVFGIAGTPMEGAAEIAVVELNPLAVYSRDYEHLRESGYKAVVIITKPLGPGVEGLALLNAERFPERWGVPVVQVSSVFRERVMKAVESGEKAKVVSRTERRVGKGENLVVTIRGRDREGPPLIVLTPRSGWWTCASERGGGIVGWLACLKAFAERLLGSGRETERDVVFVATTGHELGYIGLEAFLSVPGRAGWAKEATWFHFGANLGDNSGSPVRVMSAHDDLRNLAGSHLARQSQAFELVPANVAPLGETREVHRQGGRYVTFVAAGPLFHTERDRMPEAVDVEAVERIGKAASAVTLELAGLM